MNQSEFQAIPCNLLKPQEKSCAQAVIGFGFAYHCFTNCRDEIF